MKKLLIISFFTLSALFSNAQQDAMFTHYMFNTLAVNPAYAGTRDALTVTALHRSQWVGFPGAPITQTITMHTPFLTKNIGLGLSIINDKIGPTNTTSMYVDFAYKIVFGTKGNLSFGLKGGMNVRNEGLSNLDLNTVNDPVFLNDLSSKLLPNFGFGMYYYNDKFYAGLSIPKLLENDYISNSTSGTTNLASEKRHYFLIAGYVFKLSESLDLKPTCFLKVTTGAPVEGDITASFIFNKKYWLGAMFRTGDATGILAGMNITDQFALGYSFDWSYTNTSMRYNGGSHELVLRYDFVFHNEQKIRSPRYF
jgi:type IX secretion system PorP/SprF family membrane protein